jgi:hypothetical protein
VVPLGAAGGPDGRIRGPDGRIRWRRREAAEAFYTGLWLDGIRQRYGMDPQIKFFETACITDNVTGAVLLPDVAG